MKKQTKIDTEAYAARSAEAVRMLYPKNIENELDRELFEQPSCEYRGTPFWSWNCRVTKELIADQLEIFRKMGFGGAHLHPRTGLETEYMGEEYLSLVRFADEQAKEKGMLCWLYDEDRFPSGAAGGIVTENLAFRARHLLLTRERKEGMSPSVEAFRESIKKGEKPAGYYLTAYRIRTENGYLQSYRRIEGEEPLYDSEEETQKEGKLWLAYVELMRESPWFNDQTYIDVMNRDAVKRFIEVTHECYYQVLGKEFGKSVPAIFTDEPQIKGSMALADGETEADVTLSFTDDLPVTYKEAYGTDLLEVLPELLWELPQGRASVHRLHYHDHLAERFVSAYSDTIADWCEEHGIAMTGHYMSEPTLYSQTLRLGEAMRCYRRQQLPGVDILCGDPEYSTVKQAVSVARQNGREGVLSELYGVTHWDFDFKGHKLQGDWQAALGVTIRVPHLAFMSMEGEAKRDWPASISYQSPWWEAYSYIENYFARVNTALTRGKAIVNTAVIHPIESYWISYGPAAQTGELRNQMDGQFKDLIEWLLYGLSDFDFLSESMLPGQSGGAGNGALLVGEMSYHTVVVPPLRTIRASTLDCLEALLDAGGRVIFMGKAPDLVDGIPDERAKRLAERAECICFSRFELMQALEQERLLEIRREDGARTDNLFYQLRQDKNCRWLFVCHTKRKNSRQDQAERLLVQVRGNWSITCCDALTGSWSSKEAEYRNGWTCLPVTMYAEDSFLWKLEPVEKKKTEVKKEGWEAEPQAADRVQKAGYFQIPTAPRLTFYGLVAASPRKNCGSLKSVHTILCPDRFSLEEPNVLLLDRAAWRLDQGEWQPEEDILRLDNQIRTAVGYPHRQDAYKQPWRVGYAPKEHTVMLRFCISSQITADKIKLAMERPEDAQIFWNGRPAANTSDGWYVDSFIRTVPLTGLEKGDNELLLVIPYGRKTNLENCFLLGAFGVDVRGTEARITEAPKRLLFGDVSRQGLAFYGGTVCYDMEFMTEKQGSAVIRVPHFRAPAIEVILDGEKRGLIAFSPNELRVQKLSPGVHSLTLRVYGNRFNTFGTLHNCNEEYKWYGPDSYRTKGSDWSEAWCLRPFGILSRAEIVEE